MNYFKSKRLKTTLILLFFTASLVIASEMIGFDWLLMLQNFTKAFQRFIVLYLPPDFSNFSMQLKELGSTILLSVSGAVTGMILAFFAALAISIKTGKIKSLKIPVRFIASLSRNIPEGVWAIILLLCFWFGEFLAYLVMCIISFGFLTRVFADAIDETNANAIEALEATGASYWQIVFHAIIPETLPALLSWSLYAIENNIRSATIVGMLAGGGIGFLIGNYKDFRQFPQLFSAVSLVVVTILFTDQCSTQIRKRILS